MGQRMTKGLDSIQTSLFCTMTVVTDCLRTFLFGTILRQLILQDSSSWLLTCSRHKTDVCIAKIGGSSNFSDFWWIHRGVGCEITSAHFSS
jgi:hypothetical protein